MKKILCITVAILMLALTFTACGNNPSSDEPTTINTEGFPEITVGVAKGKSPQDEVMYGLELHFPEYGYKLTYKEYDTGEQALAALEKGEVDFTLMPTKKEYNKFNSDALVNLGPVYYYPMAIYIESWDSASKVENGASIAIPDDAENMARALLLLEANGYITLKEDAGFDATLDDIVKNDRGFDIKAVAHNQVCSIGADIFVMGSLEASNAGYERGFDAWVSETDDSDSAVEYAVGLIVRKADLKTPEIDLVEKYFFTRRMYQSIDGSTDNIISPMFDLKQ